MQATMVSRDLILRGPNLFGGPPGSCLWRSQGRSAGIVHPYFYKMSWLGFGDIPGTGLGWLAGAFILTGCNLKAHKPYEITLLWVTMRFRESGRYDLRATIMVAFQDCPVRPGQAPIYCHST